MSTHIFEYIGDSKRFGYGMYLDLRIIIDSKTNYINATKLCALGNKKLFNWHKTDSSKELIACYNESIVSPSDQKGIQYEISGGDLKGLTRKEQEIIMGTYYHKSIVVHIAQWISPTFAFKVSKIVDDYIDTENSRKIRELKGENMTLQDQIAKLLATTETILAVNHKQNEKLDKMTSAIEKMRIHLDNSTSVPSKREAILVYRNPDDTNDIMRFRCGTQAYLKTYKANAKWYKEYKNISNSKKAINYMKVNNMIEFEKDKTTKAIIPDQDDRLFIRKCLRRLDASYLTEA
jgi:hypothetical protein